MTTSNEIDRPYPPIAWITSGALGLVIIGGVWMASHAPRRAPLGIAVALLCAAAFLMLVAATLLARQRIFAWSTFRKVLKWGLLAYVIEAGMIEYAFVRDHTSGASLVIVTLMLLIFATSPPMTIAFTVARYHDPD